MSLVNIGLTFDFLTLVINRALGEINTATIGMSALSQLCVELI
ncbi:hypothetical protein U0021_00130 [Moraxella canis]|uniref:Uncharacterized protein n=1 Tax=Moraxella canis TaxID=90239 RepID=A0ABZ0WXQ3_9GAMM|nr:hypothetical protein [Moraxella canis]WQE04048.1 hypothetical protein U0021_00130 [Moraxella canis]